MTAIRNTVRLSLIAAALVAAFGAQAHGSDANVAGSNSVISASGSAVSVSGTGSATSQASNIGSAYTQVQAAGAAGSTGPGQTNAGIPGYTWNAGASTYNTGGKFGSVEIGAVTQTQNSSYVKTTTTGSGEAAGAAGGLATATADGNGSFHTVNGGPQGTVAGGSDATTGTGVASIGNGSATRTGGMVSEFGAASAADITYQNTKSADGVFGKADVKNASTSDYANASSMTVGAGGNSTSGTAFGGIVNEGSAWGAATAKVAGQVSVSN